MSLAINEQTSALSVRVPGKINLSLRVGNRRRDGYHQLATVFQAVNLYDTITVAHSDNDDSTIALEVIGVAADQLGPAANNLAVRAAQALRLVGGISAGCRIRLTKAIPVAAGMAGGSADAAGALLGLNALWNLGIPPEDLLNIAASLGADVPFGLMGGCAVGLGRGDLLAPALSRGVCHWVLGIAHQGLSTPAVFHAFDQLATDKPATDEPEIDPGLMRALASGDTQGLADALTNDLAPAAYKLRPGLRPVLEQGVRLGALAGVVSGSGPTIAWLTADAASATDLALSLSCQGLVDQVRQVTGPVAGASFIAAG
ncbi:MAG: 4-(cytidine 5'-diphospho)-2-C-methyl-D-erythritol kinase [Propionibacteriaceae bacterium]|jgi:4-diphosphocytidyl-2-C-methyl-D-erythritol kinase|nr:4-(cytidine 5'-diphospho)-2-C-methyl-D-erythritol kinase [Propionibacteriaceae bacterium]